MVAMKLVGVVLAGGNSRRAGVLKPAHVHAGKSLLAHAVDGMAPWCERVVVVVGYRADEVATLVRGHDGVTTILNPMYTAGMFTSVQTGVQALDAGADGFFVLPVDCPLVRASTYETLVASFEQAGGNVAILPECDGRGGHPVLLPMAARDTVLAEPATSRLRDVMRRLHPRRVAVSDRGILMDIDTAADLEALSAIEEGTR